MLVLKFAAFIERKVLASSLIASCFYEHLERKLSFLTVEMFSLAQIFFVENIGGILQFHIFLECRPNFSQKSAKCVVIMKTNCE